MFTFDVILIALLTAILLADIAQVLMMRDNLRKSNSKAKTPARPKPTPKKAPTAVKPTTPKARVTGSPMGIETPSSNTDLDDLDDDDFDGLDELDDGLDELDDISRERNGRNTRR